MPFISKEDITKIDFDYLIVTSSEYFGEISKEAVKLGIPSDKIIPQNIVMFPGFSIEKYKLLKNSRLSIIADSCFAGLIYHRFGLPFLSPTINMWESGKSFLTMVSDLKEYMNQPLKFCNIKFSPTVEIVYPVYLLGDVELNMNHYNNFDYAEKKWYERVKRINYDNLLIVMRTNSEEELEIFDKLPYEKKACFVSFKSDLKSAFYIPFIGKDTKLWQYVNNLARGAYPFYDLWDLMLYGKKTPRMNFDKLYSPKNSN